MNRWSLCLLIGATGCALAVSGCTTSQSAAPDSAVPSTGAGATTGAQGAGAKPGQVAAVSNAEAPTGAAVERGAGAGSEPVDGTVYGDGVTLTESTPISAILDDVDAFAGQRVRVEGLITAVCETRGCWIDLAGDREFEVLRIKVPDGVIVFPIEVRGKYAVAEGIVAKVDPDQPAGEGLGQHMGEGEGGAGGSGGAGVHEGEGEAAGSGDGGMHAEMAGRTARIDGTGAVIRDNP